MRRSTLQADLMLLLVAVIWGFAFVAQRLGLEHLGPFGFNACRFLLGAVSLLPLLLFLKPGPDHCQRQILKYGAVAGLVLFAGASFQQAGLVYTTAGNAGFITGLYIILVPVLGIFMREHTSINTWIGGILAVIGLYLLSFQDLGQVNIGDILELMGAVCWAVHVLLIAKLAPKIDNLRLAISQFLFCALLSFIVALSLESSSFVPGNIAMSWAAIAYAGIISVGIAYTLQIYAQKHAAPAHAAIIMSLEAVAAAFGGWLILNEQFSHSGLIGCTLMLIGMLLSQLPSLYKFRKRQTL